MVTNERVDMHVLRERGIVGKIPEKCLWREVVKMAENMSSVYYTSVELDWVN